MNNNRNIQQDNPHPPLSFNAKCAIIGFFGGLVFTVAGYITYLLNFTSFGPAFILSSWFPFDWGDEVTGHVLSIFILAFLSVFVAFIYRLLFAGFYSMWVGILYGIMIWAVVFTLLNPIFPKLQPVRELNADTLVTTLCLCVIYGLFIGYSISFEYRELNRETAKDIDDPPS